MLETYWGLQPRIMFRGKGSTIFVIMMQEFGAEMRQNPEEILLGLLLELDSQSKTGWLTIQVKDLFT
jgi:hypothetical protein